MRILFALTVFLLVLHRPSIAQDESHFTWLESQFSAKAGSQNADENQRLLDDKLKVAREENDPQGQARAMMELAAFQFSQLKNYGKSLDWLIKALLLEDSSNLQTEKVLTFIAMARVFEEVGELPKGMKQLEQAQAINKETNLELQLIILNEKGRINTKMHAFEEAADVYQTMLRHGKNADLREWEGDALYALGKTQASLKDFQQALKNHKDGLAIRRELQNRAKEAESLNSIGLLYMQEKNFERAKANFEVAINIRKKLNDLIGVAESYNNAGLMYMAQKDYKQAISNINLALKSARDAEAQDQILKASESLSICFKELGDFKQALQYREQYSGINDMIQQERDRNELIEIESAFALEEKETEIGKLAANMAEHERTIETQQKERNFLILVIALGAAIGILILYLYYLIRKTNKKLKEINETKDKLFSIIGHDLKAPLNSLTAFSSLLIHHSESLSKEEIKMLSGDVDKSLKNLFSLLDNLLEWGRSQTGNIDFTPAPFDLGVVIQENYDLLKAQAEKKNIRLVIMNQGSIIINAHRNSINTVVRNLINNAIKFTPDRGQITLQAETVGNQVKVTISDNGVGMNKETQSRIFQVGNKHSTLGTAQEKGTGLGLIICKDFIEKNGGTIGVESEQGKGSKFFFTLSRQS